MRRCTFFLSLIAVVALVAGAMAQGNTTTTTNNMKRSSFDDCDPNRSHFDDLPTYAAEETQTLPAGVNKLFIHGVKNGGVSVQGGSGSAVQLKICKLVAAEDDATAQRRLAMIRPQISGGDISAVGPDDGRWVVHFFLTVPNGISVQAEAHNGPMQFRNVNGIIDAHTVNGPLSFKGVSGTVTGSAQNGPISISQCSGEINLTAQNGPLAIDLGDKQWNGSGLQASTHNGPISVRVPANYATGVDIEASRNSPFRCDLAECAGFASSKPWDHQQTVHIGGSPTLVKLSTVNGPVSIHGPRTRDDSN